MFELPEFVVLARQMNETLKGKTIKKGSLDNAPHKFVWYNRTHEEFEKLTRGKKVGEAHSKGRWLFLDLNPSHVLVFGECGGKMLWHPSRSRVPKKYHLFLLFDDDSFFTATTQMWGAMELYEKGKEKKRQYVKDMRVTPTEKQFTYDYFSNLVDSQKIKGKMSAKELLTQHQIIPGLGNAMAQDILFKARLHPRYSINKLNGKQRRKLYDAIINTTNEIIEKGGRYDEYDLHNNPGKYVRLMDKESVGRPCPQCGTKVEKIQFLGGACYYCPHCQKEE